MLRIKDNINLRELENFGYKLGQDTVNVPYWEYGKETPRKDKVLKISVNEKDLIFVIVVGKKREVYFKVSARNGFRNYVFDDEEVVKPYIEDLIQADLVEKV